jgi:hypothetical protein
VSLGVAGKRNSLGCGATKGRVKRRYSQACSGLAGAPATGINKHTPSQFRKTQPDRRLAGVTPASWPLASSRINTADTDTLTTSYTTVRVTFKSGCFRFPSPQLNPFAHRSQLAFACHLSVKSEFSWLYGLGPISIELHLLCQCFIG